MNKSRSGEEYATKNAHIKALLRKVKYRAKKNKTSFNLDFEYTKSIACDFCPVFETKILWGADRKLGSYDSPSIDRINPNLGYEKGNVQILSHRANLLKNNATVDEIRTLLKFMENR